ncbi:MAG: DNA polymerase III subunit delta' [Rhodospirillales bacterium]|nr:DNA polymerase III subunit delta' [Rhodospirillales bacterium]
MDLFGEPDPPEAETNDIAEQEAEDAATPEGLTHPREMSLCLSHKSIETRLLEQINAGRMPHGLIFSGPKGIGKATFAYRLARTLLKHEASEPNQNSMFADEPAGVLETMDIDPADPVFRQVASGGHADLLTIEREYDAAKNTYKGSIAVDAIRKVNPFLRLTASKDGGWRVVIIDDADTMNRSAQNALLKILEEPPPRAVLILICHRLGAMIPTIRSRTRTLSFSPPSKESFEYLLQMQGHTLEPTQLDTLYHLSEGSAGAGLHYLEQGGLDTLSEILTLFDYAPEWPWPDVHKLADQLGRAGRDQSYQSFALLLPWIFSQMITAKARGREIASAALHIEAIQRLHQQSSLESLLKICENLKHHFDRVERSNLDKRQAVLGAFSIIAA